MGNAVTSGVISRTKWIGWVVMLLLTPLSAQDVRIKDIANLEGVRDNMLTGYGIVVGLMGTGDKDQTRFTTQTLANALSKSGIKLDPTNIKVANVAMVLVQAELPPFARNGHRIDIQVSSLGDAASLQGGTLLVTELKAVDGKTYALAQGPISVGGFSAGGAGSSVVQNHPTVGTIPNGAIVEREVNFDFLTLDRLHYIFYQEDFTTMDRAVAAVNEMFGSEFARPLNSRTMQILVPPEFRGNNMVALVARIENLTLRPDQAAKIVINERTGTIIIGQKVVIEAVAISHGDITIQVQVENTAVPGGGQVNAPGTVNQQNTNTEVREEPGRVFVAEQAVTLGQIAETLNALKVSPRDVISILQAMKEAGAIHAELKLI
ncbi:flagellar basal body P-ring protein FlgI [Acanthopleuribacter pedis]|uniref:Flagellar P-ring protein n=1 Tax=Acanthopleuribacter pedis TaxID=442870 RepID=A0A8J7Q0Q8_9BACT|nr:flagellar basal body P-ring protein FlgI [Acanthopleuribacter pedis]MBO1317100.1 flagellar basal body P-ring protein FlgI [Acanthopleuribacter pedis]